MRLCYRSTSEGAGGQRIMLWLVRRPVVDANVLAFSVRRVESVEKHFQNRRVSSPAALTTVWPSGDMARCSTREVWPVEWARREECEQKQKHGLEGIVQKQPCESKNAHMGRCSTCQLGNLGHGRVLPDAELVLGEAVAGHNLLVGLGPHQGANLRLGVDGVEACAGLGVPEADGAVSSAAAAGQQIVLPRAPGKGSVC